MAVVILKRADLMPGFADLEAGEIRVDHFGFDPLNRWRADLIVFIENDEIKVLQAFDWPPGKAMSGDELHQYVIQHVAEAPEAPVGPETAEDLMAMYKGF